MKITKTRILIAVVIILVLGYGSFADSVRTKIEAWLRPDLTINMNGEELVMTDVNGDVVHPLTYNGTTYLPARAISENLDLEVGWDENTQTVSLIGDGYNQNENELLEYGVSFTREEIDGGFRFTANVPNDEEYNYEWKFLSNGEELATFDKPSIPIEFKNEGSYTIELRVQNTDGYWSKTYTDEFYYDADTFNPLDENEISDTFNNFTIRYQTDNITDDYENKYQGDRSLKFTFDEKSQTAKIKLEGILLNNQGNISFQIKSSTRDPIHIKYVGLVGTTEIFEKNSTYVPELENTWIKLPLSVNTPSVDNLELTFDSVQSIVWIDQIEIKNYK